MDEKLKKFENICVKSDDKISNYYPFLTQQHSIDNDVL